MLEFAPDTGLVGGYNLVPSLVLENCNASISTQLCATSVPALEPERVNISGVIDLNMSGVIDLNMTATRLMSITIFILGNVGLASAGGRKGGLRRGAREIRLLCLRTSWARTSTAVAVANRKEM